MGSGSGCSGDGLEDRCLVCLVCLVYLVNQTNQIDQRNQMNQTNRHSFRTLLERRLAEFLEKLLKEGLTLLFENPAGYGDPMVQLRL
jgi:hypothetical protein